MRQKGARAHARTQARRQEMIRRVIQQAGPCRKQAEKPRKHHDASTHGMRIHSWDSLLGFRFRGTRDALCWTSKTCPYFASSCSTPRQTVPRCVASIYKAEDLLTLKQGGTKYRGFVHDRTHVGLPKHYYCKTRNFISRVEQATVRAPALAWQIVPTRLPRSER